MVFVLAIFHLCLVICLESIIFLMLTICVTLSVLVVEFLILIDCIVGVQFFSFWMRLCEAFHGIPQSLSFYRDFALSCWISVIAKQDGIFEVMVAMVQFFLVGHEAVSKCRLTYEDHLLFRHQSCGSRYLITCGACGECLFALLLTD